MFQGFGLVFIFDQIPPSFSPLWARSALVLSLMSCTLILSRWASSLAMKASLALTLSSELTSGWLLSSCMSFSMFFIFWWTLDWALFPYFFAICLRSSLKASQHGRIALLSWLGRDAMCLSSLRCGILFFIISWMRFLSFCVEICHVHLPLPM